MPGEAVARLACAVIDGVAIVVHGAQLDGKGVQSLLAEGGQFLNALFALGRSLRLPRGQRLVLHELAGQQHGDEDKGQQGQQTVIGG